MVLRVITFKLDESLLEKLDKYAMRVGKSRSDVIREAIERLLLEEYYTVIGRARVEALKVW